MHAGVIHSLSLETFFLQVGIAIVGLIFMFCSWMHPRMCMQNTEENGFSEGCLVY